MENINIKNSYEVKVYGTFDQKIAQLLEYQKKGISVFAIVHKHKLYSTNITWDKAYLEVFGLPMKEYKDAILDEERKYREKKIKKIERVVKMTELQNYTKVDVLPYVKQGLEKGMLVPRQAEKFARIIAKQGQIGETVISWSVDSFGNEVKVKEAVVGLDDTTKQPGWIATKVDENGNVVRDINGHINQWIIDDTTFKKKYEIDPVNTSLCRPKGGPQLFVQISDNIILNQWGSDMKIASGGYINITNIDDMYGISQRDFEDTYKFTDNLDTKKIK